MSRRASRRAAGAAALTALLVAATAPAAGGAIGTDDFCAEVADGAGGFSDTASVSAATRADIECLAASGITGGTGGGAYSPSATVFRDSMATFVAGLVDVANELEVDELEDLPADAADAYADDDGSTHEANIDRLAAAGIVNGKGPGAYGPNGAGNEVTRG